MLIYENQFKQPPYAAGGLRLNPRLRLCGFLILDFPDTRRRIRAHPRGRRPLEAGKVEGGNACAGRIKRCRSRFTRFGIVVRREEGRTSVFQPQRVLRDSRSVQTNSQRVEEGGRDGECVYVCVGGGGVIIPPPNPHIPLLHQTTPGPGAAAL